ncbi:MAG: pyridoxal phosphate-dependent aminotransferase [Clostridiales bacterium]|jgi:cystathionine beta-lyase|nr:pyridoxal phosphate-dependent aminotransferase [Clostridiales bacterium]
MIYNFDDMVDRRGTYSVKWDILPDGATADALPLWIADMDFPCAQPIIDAMHKRVDRLIFGYTEYDTDDLKNAITNWHKKRYSWIVPREDIFYTPGIVPGLALLINALTEENDGVIIQPPVYYPFAMKIESNNRKVVRNPLKYNDGHYTMDYEDLETKMADPNNKGIVLCNPHNPVGRVWTKGELYKVIEIAKKYNKWIISDEIHADLIRKNSTFTNTESAFPEYKDEIITLTAPSKTFNIAGLKMSNVVIHKEEYKQKFLDIQNSKFGLGGVSPIGVAAAIAAYNEGEDWLRQLNEYIDENIKYCTEFFKKELPKSVPVEMEGTYLLWVDLSAYVADCKELEKVMLKDAKVALDEGYIFGEEGKGFERLNLACPRSMLTDCMNRMKEALLSLEK